MMMVTLELIQDRSIPILSSGNASVFLDYARIKKPSELGSESEDFALLV
jgi:hypothetical protein